LENNVPSDRDEKKPEYPEVAAWDSKVAAREIRGVLADHRPQ
jgi:hypothetical protein